MDWRCRCSKRWAATRMPVIFMPSGAPRGIKIVWHDGIGMSLYAKPLERGRFIWPSPADGILAITAAQLASMETPGRPMSEPAAPSFT